MKRYAALVSILSVAGVQLLHAQQPDVTDTVYALSPVIITATQARERETPATFSNLPSRDLKERYSMQDVPVILSELPSITTYSENGNGIGYNYINLRGFDQRRISVMINGIPQNDPEDHNVYWIDVPDLMASTGNIQVQRGAGSAFYGPPAIGGSVNLVTNPFRPEPGVTIESLFGFQSFADSSKSISLASKKLGISFNSGLVGGQYMLYGRLSRITSDGYRANSWVDLKSYFFGVIRLDGSMTTRLHAFGGPLQDGLAYTGLPKFVKNDRKQRRQNLASWSVDPAGNAYSFAQQRRPQETEDFSQPHYELIHDWRVSPTLTINNTFFYYTGDGFFDYDASWADTTTLRLGSAYGIPASGNPDNTLVRAYVGNRQWGWLPRMEIEHGSGRLTVGGEIRFHRSTHWGKISFANNLPVGLDPDYHFYEYNGEKDVLSLYAHEVFRPRENLTVTADLQVVRNRYGIAREKFLGNNFSLPYLFINPRVGVNLNITPEWNGYVSLAYTSREPRLRNLYAAEDAYFGATPGFLAETGGGALQYDFTRPIAKPEHLFDVELGAGWRSGDARFMINGFWMEFTDELVKNGQVDVFGQPVTGNASRTRHLGLELEGALPVGGGISLNGTFTGSYNRIVRYAAAATPFDGNPVAGFPDLLGNLRLTYRNDRLMSSVHLQYVGAFYTDNEKNAANRNDAYAVCNAEVLYRVLRLSRIGLTLRGEIRNIFDALYFSGGEGDAFFPAAERNYVAGVTLDF